MAQLKPAQVPLRFGGRTVPATRAAKMLGCSTQQVRCYLAEGRLDGYQLVPGGWWRVYFDSVVALLGEARRAADI